MSPSSAGLRISPPDAPSAAETLEGAADPVRQSRAGSAGACPALHMSLLAVAPQRLIAETRMLVSQHSCRSFVHAKRSVLRWHVAAIADSFDVVLARQAAAQRLLSPRPGTACLTACLGRNPRRWWHQAARSAFGTRWVQRAQPRTFGTQRKEGIERRRLQRAGRPAAGAHSPALRGS